MAAPLETLLHALTSGYGVMPQEIVDLYGGQDAILKTLQSFDPNAQAVVSQTYGGEGGGGPDGIRFDFDISKAPTSKAGTLGLDLRPANFGTLKNPNATLEDANYGDVTNSANVRKPTDPLWVKIAPLIPSVVAPWAAGALAGAGIGGAAGLTSAATGSGLTGAGTIPQWAAQALMKAPSIAGQVGSGNFNPTNTLLSLLMGPGASALGIPPGVMQALRAGMTLAQLSGQRGR